MHARIVEKIATFPEFAHRPKAICFLSRVTIPTTRYAFSLTLSSPRTTPNRGVALRRSRRPQQSCGTAASPPSML
jgi:hypothetical protein